MDAPESKPLSHRRWWSILILACVALGRPALSLALQIEDVDPLPDWHISGSNTFRTDYHEFSGDPTGSPYTIEGPRGYDEFTANFSRIVSPYENWLGQVSGVFNDSPYRSPDRGFLVERVNLRWEKGAPVLPFRAELGDMFSYFSYRTLQRPLKGAQIEVQPFPSPKRRQSILIVSGFDQPSWKHFQPDDSFTNGISYLLEDPVFGRYSLNFVHNARDGDPQQGTFRRTQFVYSLTGEKTITLKTERITLEGELSRFDGDHDGVTGPASGQGRREMGVFLQASGQSKTPLTYRVRFENYGQDYRPVNASVSPDRRSLEGHVGWLFPKGYQLRGRVQGFRDSLETANPLDTYVYGLNLTGPLGFLDAFLQDVQDRNRTTDSLTSTLNLVLNIPRIAGWSSRLGYLYQNIDQQIAGIADTRTHQLSLSADHSIAFWVIKGTITPGFVARWVDNAASEGVDLSPTLALSLTSGPHSLAYNLGLASQDRRAAGSVDVSTTTHNLTYRFSGKQNTIGVELIQGHRNPNPGMITDYYRIGAFWTYYFDKPPTRERGRERATPAAAAPVGFAFNLLQLVPGSKIESLKQTLAASNFTSPIEDGGLVVYEKRILEEIDLRQRLALVREGDVLTKAGLIIDIAPADTPNDLMRTFERVRKLLLDTYGNPTSFHQRGEISARLFDDIRRGDFVRFIEWSRPEGILRFGIPRRLDGQIRMEIQVAESFPPVGDTLWSIEGVR